MTTTSGSWLSHLNELRLRLFRSLIAIAVCSGIAFIAFDSWVMIILSLFEQPAQSSTLYMTTIFEGFSTKVTLSCILGIGLASPWWLCEALRFIFPGLTSSEKRWISVALVAGLLLAGIGGWFGYAVILPISIQFLTSSQLIPSSVGTLLNYEHSVFYVIKFLGYSLILFQFPVVLECLMMLNIIQRQTLWRSSRYVIVAIVIISAIVTPPDIVSQLGLAGPLIGLYFLTLLVAKICRFGESSC